ncbi:MAG: response regulator transcription factor [Imperialibacter sp.]|uniref:response regulator transcription factor n=1 Tax=Imperialibacter sp. TaxID=2038411 RepID=UPI0032EB3B15
MEIVKILICEDDEALSSLIRFKLSRAGYTNCELAADGKKAKEMIRDNEYDLVITDIHMPYASGLELTTYIRVELKRKTPIIILSSEGVENTVLQSFKLGINDFLTKPFSPQELVIRVKRLLGHQ